MRTFTLSYAKRTPPTRIDVVQYTTAPDIGFYIEDFTPVGRAQIYIEKPSGEKIYNNCTIDGNLVVFTPTTQCFAEVGISEAQLQILDGNEMAVSFKIFFIVEENIIDDSAVESVSEFTELQAAISTIGQYDQRIQDVQDDMSDLDTNLTNAMNTLDTDLTGRMSDLETQVGEDITTIEGTVQELSDISWKRMTLLTRNDNLDDLGYYEDNENKNGWYYANTGNIPVNSPYNNAFILEHIRFGQFSIQRAMRVGTPGRMAVRSKNEVNWGQWREVIMSVVSPSMNELPVINNLKGYAWGFITSGSTDLRFMVPMQELPPSLGITKNSISELSIAVRGIDGYVQAFNGVLGSSPIRVIANGEIDPAGPLNASTSSFNVYKRSNTMLQVTITQGVAFTKQNTTTAYSNNTPLAIDYDISVYAGQ